MRIHLIVWFYYSMVLLFLYFEAIRNFFDILVKTTIEVRKVNNLLATGGDTSICHIKYEYTQIIRIK